MKMVYAFFVVTLTAVVVLFALSNRQIVELALWPLPFAAAAPVYVLVLGMFALGFFCGGFAAWRRSLRVRSRVAERRTKPLEEEVTVLRKQVTALEAEQPHPGDAGEAEAPRAIASER